MSVVEQHSSYATIDVENTREWSEHGAAQPLKHKYIKNNSRERWRTQTWISKASRNEIKEEEREDELELAAGEGM